MSFLEVVIAAIIAGLIVSILVAFGPWLWRKLFRPEIRIMTATKQGPTSRELGFTEPAVKITIINKSDKALQIRDIRLMFCSAFGVAVHPKAPGGFSHRQLPVCLASGASDHWYIPAEQLSAFLRGLHHLPGKAGAAMPNLKIYARCITSTDKVYKGPSFPFSTDSNSFWSSPLAPPKT